MIKEYLQTRLGQMAITTSRASNSKGTLFFWSGMFFDGTMWDAVTNFFCKDYTIVVIDPPGHGASDAPKKIFSIQDCSSVVVEILDHLKLPSCTFVGLSWGGFVAQSFFNHFPERCDGLILMNTCSRGPGAADKFMFSILPRMLSLFGAKSFEGALRSSLLCEASVKGNPALVSRLRFSLQSLDFKALKPVLFSVMKYREGLENCISGKEVKCLVLYGDQDKAIDHARTSHMTSLLPPETTVKKLSAGHNVVLEAEEEVIVAMQGFLT